MVRGLELWREHFAAFSESYILIGGVACHLGMERIGSVFRATQDLDIVLCLERNDPAFVRAFWEFVKAAGYQTQERGDGHHRVYRFFKPKDDRYPSMLELFSRLPEGFDIAGESHLTPLPMSNDISSLSAILLDDDYYALIQAGRRVDNGLPYLALEYIIPLKARAWLDLTARRKAGEGIDSAVVKKHRNDCVRLAAVIRGDVRVELTERLRADIVNLIIGLADSPTKPEDLGLAGLTMADIEQALRAIYLR